MTSTADLRSCGRATDMVATAALAAPRLSRIGTWFGSPAAQPQRDDADARRRVDRLLYAVIGDFLDTHRLAPSPLHFEVAHAYLTGEVPPIAEGIAAMIASGDGLTSAGIAALIARVRPEAAVPQVLATLADQLQTRLAECLEAADRSHSSASRYGDALDIAQDELATDPSGTIGRIAGLTRDVVETTRRVQTELDHTRRETEKLRGDLDRALDAAEHDHLTGLPNRRGVERKLAEWRDRDATDTPRPRAVALCDIDDFKRVNDVHGHAAGDRVLKFVGTFLADTLGTAACVGRHGGEEFIVLIDGHDVAAARMLLDDARARLAARSLVNQDTGIAIGHISFSAGITAFDDSLAPALEAADAALYRAKRSGKNRVETAASAA
ncbi:hypothetical protein ASE86_02465 [Sphingomonas sp. Leaf33]|uniref:GGDEF domain-containing protein n=1 Tax=Sphingomonas sp. Leaf33 TaxID=1736215 RepID=UPI0006F4ED55|nr:GGDEF domain-containing protein [Sphingomonas sp. Leaf33]KQN25141.1 hypothetical protein ASE86_02465 [Sphingomonas sp. Leaf33]